MDHTYKSLRIDKILNSHWQIVTECWRVNLHHLNTNTFLINGQQCHNFGQNFSCSVRCYYHKHNVNMQHILELQTTVLLNDSCDWLSVFTNAVPWQGLVHHKQDLPSSLSGACWLPRGASSETPHPLSVKQYLYQEHRWYGPLHQQHHLHNDTITCVPTHLSLSAVSDTCTLTHLSLLAVTPVHWHTCHCQQWHQCIDTPVSTWHLLMLLSATFE